MRVEDLRTFSTIAEIGNLHRAAEKIGVTQSALSKSLRRLETALGVRLFERTARGVVLTAIGKALNGRVHELELQLDSIRIEANEMRAGQAGCVRLGAVPAIIESVIAPVLGRFMSGERQVQFEVCVQLSATLLHRLEDGALDFAIASVPREFSNNLVHDLLGPQKINVVARADHPILRREVTLADLVGCKWLLLPADITLRGWIDRMFGEGGFAVPKPFVQADMTPALFGALVRNTDLLTVMTQDMMASPMGSGLVAIPLPATPWIVQLGLFRRRRAPLTPLMADCRREIRKSFRAMMARIPVHNIY